MNSLLKRGLAVAAATVLIGSVASTPAYAETEVDRPSEFTSAFTVNATPDNVIGTDGQPAPGQPGASGTFNFMINSDEEIICYDITLRGVTGEYQSMAKTATHIHQTAAGENGPPRISFPNPTGDGDTRTSSGCLKGPFTTGIEADGKDTGEGFSLKSIEDNPAGFSADTHTADYVPGAVRGQLTRMPVGGVETGMGGSADSGAAIGIGVGLGAVVAAAAGIAVARRRVNA